VQDRFDDGEEEPPPIRLVVAEGGEDVTIKVWGGWGRWLRGP
jgi:pyruvate dehydrogenase kinase 2/3/4